jgi:hypothetical protein
MDNKIISRDIAVKESDIDTECASCRFIPCNKPNYKNHGVPFYCTYHGCPHSRSNKYIHLYFFSKLLENWDSITLMYIEMLSLDSQVY